VYILKGPAQYIIRLCAGFMDGPPKWVGVAAVVRVTGLPRRTIYGLRTGKTKAPTTKTLAAVVQGLTVLDGTGMSTPHDSRMRR
jgi:hypothetical protein